MSELQLDLAEFLANIQYCYIHHIGGMLSIINKHYENHFIEILKNVKC